MADNKKPVETKIEFKYFFKPERHFSGPDYCDCCRRFVDATYEDGECFWIGWHAWNAENFRADKSKSYEYLSENYPDSNKFGREADRYISLCAECIASGKANKKYGVTFTPYADSVIEERTPSFYGLQQAQWENHCDEPCMYIGSVSEIEAMFQDNPAVGAEISERLKGKTFSDAIDVFCKDTGFTKEKMKSACDDPYYYNIHIFKCLECGCFVAYDEYD